MLCFFLERTYSKYTASEPRSLSVAQLHESKDIYAYEGKIFTYEYEE